MNLYGVLHCRLYHVSLLKVGVKREREKNILDVTDLKYQRLKDIRKRRTLNTFIVPMLQALSIIHQLGLRPKRTMRAVLWTSEEEGLIGANQYYDLHKVRLMLAEGKGQTVWRIDRENQMSSVNYTRDGTVFKYGALMR